MRLTSTHYLHARHSNHRNHSDNPACQWSCGQKVRKGICRHHVYSHAGSIFVTVLHVGVCSRYSCLTIYWWKITSWIVPFHKSLPFIQIPALCCHSPLQVKFGSLHSNQLECDHLFGGNFMITCDVSAYLHTVISEVPALACNSAIRIPEEPTIIRIHSASTWHSP